MNPGTLRKLYEEGKATEAQITEYLLSIPVWTVKQCAAYRRVNTTFYRRNLLDLPGHPTPIDPNAKNLSWWSEEMAPWLDDPANLKRSAGVAA
jgi:hypothetical protein